MSRRSHYHRNKKIKSDDLDHRYRVPKNRKIYGNCMVYSPDDILMFRCDEKKINWYLSRNLAHKICDEPLSIKLNFKPKGLGKSTSQYCLNEIPNRCVCCGSEEYLTQHHVIPNSYRKFFPIDLKSNNFHDILILCGDCHSEYELKANELKNKIAIDYDVPIDGVKNEDVLLVNCIKMAKTIINDKNIPIEYKNKLILEINSYFNFGYIDDEKLEEIANMVTNNTLKTHGEVVVSKLTDIQSFVEMWRKHFVENTNCKYLPENWNIYFKNFKIK